jgi:RNA polymerase sigma-70 factor (ECF subfamily)
VDDAVQEAWLRLSRADTAGIDNLGGWLTTVVARVCLDMFAVAQIAARGVIHRGRAGTSCDGQERSNPEHEALLADSVGLALLVVLDRLTPAERLAFVLHDMFAVPFEEIAPNRWPFRGGDASARQPCATAGARQRGRAGI